ncbi:MAG: translation elongation factor 4, partial [Alphaproteobacteria bacterium]
AAQGVEAQSVANCYTAVEQGLEVVPVLNKIDLPTADIERAKAEIEAVIGIDASDAVAVSAKTGLNVEDVLEAIVTRIPPPKPRDSDKLQALIIDSWFDNYLGVVSLVRVMQGEIKPGDKILVMSTGRTHQVDKVGVFTPKRMVLDELGPGDVGFVIANIKAVQDCKVGDTITEDRRRVAAPLAGFKPSLPVVFCGFFPVDSAEFEHLRESLQKLALNDASFHFEPENSTALGFGFRCGFLGLLHLEIVRERLAREFDIDLITTAPSVVYKLYLTNGEMMELYNPVDMPDVTRVAKMEEPWIKATIFVPGDYLGSVITLCTERRGEQVDLTWVGTRAMLVYRLPLNEVVYDFYDRLKSISRGYASFDYHIEGYREGDLVKVQILVNGEQVDALSMIVTRTAAEARGRQVCERLKDLIPRQLFAVPIQAAIGGKIIARETISAMRKDVTAKCYGGDVSRKRKLLDKQKEGKKRLREFGSVEIPQSAFIEALRMKDR